MSFNKRNYVDGETVITAENLNDIQDAIIQIVPEDVKQALLQIASKVAYIDDDGQDYYDALESALYPDATLVSISAVYTQSGTVYDTMVLDGLKPNLVVTGHFSDSSTSTITSYTLSGTLEVGTSTITVTYNGKTTTFDVTVSSRIPSTYKQVEYIEASGNQAITTDIVPRNTRTICTFEFTQFVGSQSGSGIDNFITGVYNSNNMRYLAVAVDQYNKLTFKGRDNSYQWNGVESPTGKHTVDFNNASHQAIYDGVVRATSVLFPIYSGNNKLAIFARGNATVPSQYNTTYGYARIYSLKYIDNDSGNTVGEFIPCYRKADNAIGMYDLVSETFYENVNSGDPFIKGDDAWETKALSSISAVFTQNGTVYATDRLDSLRTDLVVTAHYNDGSTATIDSYELSGTLTSGTSTVTVTLDEETTTFSVTVTDVSYPITSGDHIYTGTNYNGVEIKADKSGMVGYFNPNPYITSGGYAGPLCVIKDIDDNSTSPTSDVVNNIADTIFTIPSGAEVSIQITDILCKADGTNSTLKRFAVALRQGSTSVVSTGNISFDETSKSVTQTVATATNINCLFVYVGSAVTDLSFNIKIFVNGTRWL